MYINFSQLTSLEHFFNDGPVCNCCKLNYRLMFVEVETKFPIKTIKTHKL